LATDPSTAIVIPAIDPPDVDRDTRLALFRLVLLHRLTEERIMNLYKQGRIQGSVYTGRGQEAVGVGAGLALGPDDVCAPLNREMGCHFARGVEVAHVLRHYLGRATGPTQGRDGNMHFGVPERGIFPLVSMLGDLVPVVVGAAFTFKRRDEPRVSLTFFGDGAFNCGDVHEGLNLAGVLDVPVVFIAQSNRVAYSTATERAMRNPNLAERITGGYSIPCERVDGTDALAVYTAVRAAVERARAGGGPQAIEALSLRMDGHAAHDDGRYMDRDLLREFGTRRDPVERLAVRLRLDGMRTDEIDVLRAEAVAEVAAGLAEAEGAPAPDPATLQRGVYASPVP
jgi:TPP-dependent pyruvate/acetoin dehydrogenase alpha subunit